MFFALDVADSYLMFNKVLKLCWEVWTHLEERCEDYGAGITKLEGGEQLRQDFVFTEVFWERVQIVTQVLEELLLLSWLFDLERIITELLLL